jgi:hypothetical protein
MTPPGKLLIKNLIFSPGFTKVSASIVKTASPALYPARKPASGIAKNTNKTFRMGAIGVIGRASSGLIIYYNSDYFTPFSQPTYKFYTIWRYSKDRPVCLPNGKEGKHAGLPIRIEQDAMKLRRKTNAENRVFYK